MKKFLLIMLLISTCAKSQVGINTTNPVATLDITATPGDLSKIDGLVAPRLSGNELKTKDALYEQAQTGAIVYATAAANPVTSKTINVTQPGYYYFDSLVWVSLSSQSPIGVLTRFVGGTVYVRMADATGGSLPTTAIIGGSANTSYSVGSLTASSSKGGINSVRGDGYTISNPQTGIFDIKLNVAMTDIYGISVNIVDAYGISGGGVATGTNPDPNNPGMRLFTNDNSQVSFISNSIVRIKTGTSAGTLSNRSFTFQIIGR